MALIGTLRNKMGTWVVIFVFVAISAFVLNDLLGNNSVLMGSNDVGEIAGNTISLEEYQGAIQEREASFILNTNRQPGDRDMPGIRQEAWEMLILRNAIQKQYEKVGVAVSDDEVWDMIQGKNIDPGIRQSFTNPETGIFDQQQVVNYLQQLRSAPEGSEPRIRWEIYQRELRPARERIKYENLMIKSSYVTTAEAEREFHVQSDVAEVRYVFIPYFAISDTAINITDSDYQAYYNENKERYKTDQTRDLQYVSFSVDASAEDTLDIRTEMEQIARDFKTTENDSTFALINSDGADSYITYRVGNLPTFIAEDQLTEGNIIGPFVDGNSMKVAKVSKVGTDTIYSAKASHILIQWTDESDASKQTAKDQALDILKDLKGGADFAEKAREFSADNSNKNTGGDLGWFESGIMVKPFQDAVFAATRTGLLNDVVETQFGYHIIRVDETKDNRYWSVAVVEREITPSDVTINNVLRQAEIFAADLSGVDAFRKRASDEGYPLFEGKNLGPSDRRVSTLGDARQIVQWLYRDAEVGSVSEVFDLQDTYVVAVMTGEVEEGYKPLDLVRDEITTKVQNKVKARVIKDRLKNISGSLDEIAASFGKDANVYNNSGLKLSNNTLTSVGFDPKIVGRAFSLEAGERTNPIEGENGVVILELQTMTTAPEVGDYSIYKNQLTQTMVNRMTYTIGDAIKESSNIEDKRYRFY